MAVTKLKSFIVWDWRPITNYLILHVGHAYSTYGPTIGGTYTPRGLSLLSLGGWCTPKVPVLVVCCQPLHTLSYVEARQPPIILKTIL